LVEVWYGVAMQTPREVVEAEFEVVGPVRVDLDEPYEIPWGSIFWFCVYTGGFAYVAAASDDPLAHVTMVIGASVFWPLCAFLAKLREPLLPERAAERLRQRLVGGWEAAEARKAQRYWTRVAARRASRRRST
jgi:hypothetical protein